MGWFDKKRNDSSAPLPDARDAIDAYWDAIGTSDDDVISYMINPMFQGAPAWPNIRQAYSVVRRADTVIITSDGLADPSSENDALPTGFGCEVYIESPELVGASFEDLKYSWLFAAVELFAQNVAGMQGISDHLRQYGVASMELPMDPEYTPAEFMTEHGTVGALIGLPAAGRASQVNTAGGVVAIVPLTIITTAELQTVLDKGQAGRDEVAAHRQRTGTGHLTVR